MGRIVLVSGGARSGKSSFAQKRAEALAKPRLFIATCPRIDSEMDQRIEKHISDRQGKGWVTLEEEINLPHAIESNFDANVILIDCLTLWINNLIYSSENTTAHLSEETLITCCESLLQKCRMYQGTIFFVTNEVGSGIVPESSATRHYRDLVGKCNQYIGQEADEVILVSCGIPLTLKFNTKNRM